MNTQTSFRRIPRVFIAIIIIVICAIFGRGYYDYQYQKSKCIHEKLIKLSVTADFKKNQFALRKDAPLFSVNAFHENSVIKAGITSPFPLTNNFFIRNNILPWI